MPKAKALLTIAGFDPSGMAGITLDLKVFRSFSAHGVAIPAVITSQSSKKVYFAEPASKKAILSQYEGIINDFKVAGVKVGLISPSHIPLIKKIVSPYPASIYDPVLRSSSGFDFISGGKTAEITKIFSSFAIITPNIPEAEEFTGVKIRSLKDMKTAAMILVEKGAKNVLLKGGHLKEESSPDIFYDGKNFTIFQSRRINVNVRGTGCALSSLILVLLSEGFEMKEAAFKAKKILSKKIKESAKLKLDFLNF